jgi:hypothetical protein
MSQPRAKPQIMSPKSPGASYYYGIDFSNVLPQGDTIMGTPTVAFTNPAGLSDLALGAPAIIPGQLGQALAVWVRVSGGSAPNQYQVIFNVSTAQGNLDSRSIIIPVQQN